MRLIDAMAYRNVLDEEMDNLLENTKNSIKYRLGIEVAIADLGDMPTIDAVPVSELITLRDWFYESDGITMGNLALLNKLIAMYKKDGDE